MQVPCVGAHQDGVCEIVLVEANATYSSVQRQLIKMRGKSRAVVISLVLA